MHHYAGTLVHQQYIFILVHYIQMPVELAQQRVCAMRLFKQLVVQVYVKHIACCQSRVARRNLAVYPHALQPQILLTHAGGEQRHFGQHPFVQPPAVVLAGYSKLLH